MPSPPLLRSAPVFHEKILLKSSGNAEAAQLLEQLFNGCQPSSNRFSGVSLAVQLADVERSLAARLAAVTEFANRPGATGAAVAEAFLAERATFQAPPNAGGGGGPGPDGSSQEAGLTTEMSHIFKATGLPAFLAMSREILSADVNTEDGQLDAIAAGFRGDNVLGRRVLCEGARSIAGKIPALARL